MCETRSEEKPKRPPCGGEIVETARRAIGCTCESMSQACRCNRVLFLLLELKRTHWQLFYESLNLVERSRQVEAWAGQMEHLLASATRLLNSPAIAKALEGAQVVGSDGGIVNVLEVSPTSEQDGAALDDDDLNCPATISSGNQ